MFNLENEKRFTYSFDQNLTIINYFKKIKIKNLFSDILFPLNYLISHNNFSSIFSNKKNRFHKVKNNILEKKISDILSKKGDNDVYQLALNGQSL